MFTKSRLASNQTTIESKAAVALKLAFVPVQQLRFVISKADYLTALHKETSSSFNLKIEPWDPPCSGCGAVGKRRALYSAPLKGPSWFRTMLGKESIPEASDRESSLCTLILTCWATVKLPASAFTCLHASYACNVASLRQATTLMAETDALYDVGTPNLVEMVDIQEMMYDSDSGCMLMESDTYMMLDGGTANLRMHHMQWLYRPVMMEDMAGCEVIRCNQPPPVFQHCMCIDGTRRPFLISCSSFYVIIESEFYR